MPNIKSAKKRVKVNAVKALNNQMAKSDAAPHLPLARIFCVLAAGERTCAGRARSDGRRDRRDHQGRAASAA